MSAPDLIRELDRIRREAQRARTAIAQGSAKNGTSSLAKIETRAADAIRHHHEDREREQHATR